MSKHTVPGEGLSKDNHSRNDVGAVDHTGNPAPPVPHTAPQTAYAPEKRVDDRHPLELDTEVHFQEQFLTGMFRCRTSNIGLHGVYLPAKNLPINDKTSIDLVFLARTHPEPQQFRLSAKLIRLEKEGAALSFSPTDEKQAQNFRRFLLHAKVAASKPLST